MVLCWRPGDTHGGGLSADPGGQNASCKALHPRHLRLGDPGGRLQRLLESDPLISQPLAAETLGKSLKEFNKSETIDSITLVGLCTDICVISNAMLLKAFLPEVPIMVDSLCCAGVTPESHERALEAMKAR